MSKTKPAPMMYMIPFQAAHGRQIRMEPPGLAEFSLADLKTIEGPHAVTIVDDGKPIMLLIPWQIWEGRAFISFFISNDATAERFGELMALWRAYVDGLPYRRLELAIDVGHHDGHQWAKALGFSCEAQCARGFHPDGRDCALFARVREEVPHG